MIAAVDPGIRGGLCVMSMCGKHFSTLRMPVLKLDNGKKIVDAFKLHLALIRETQVVALRAGCTPTLRAYVIEDVHAMPRQGVSSMFSFGRAVGAAEAVGLIANVPVVRVAPQRWQRAVLLSAKAVHSTKQRAKQTVLAICAALRREPPKTEGEFDAFLIAEFGRQYAKAGHLPEP